MKQTTKLRYAANPADASNNDTTRLRHDFFIEQHFSDDKANMVCFLYAYMILSGGMPVAKPLWLENTGSFKAQWFIERCKGGIFNVGKGSDIMRMIGKTPDSRGRYFYKITNLN